MLRQVGLKKKIDETSKSKVNMIYSFLSLEFHMRHYNDNNCLYRIYLLLKKRQHRIQLILRKNMHLQVSYE